MTLALVVRDVSRSWHAGARGCASTAHVLRGVSFHAQPGEFLGIFGPPGSGKSTLLCVLAGLLAPDRGAVTIFGEPLRPPRPAGVAWVPERIAWYPFLTAREAIEYYATVRDLAPGERRERVNAVLERVGLATRAGAPVSDLDRPERKRLSLAQALVTRPRLLLLDEIFSGLAPSSRASLVALVREFVAEGTTVICTSRERGALESCARLLVLADGKIRDEPDRNSPAWRLALEVRVEPPIHARRLVTARRGAAALGEGRVRVPLADATPEGVLAHCRQLGIGVAWSRVVAEGSGTDAAGGW
ncbi:MAG: ABC transporter ATP-binding protein [Gemmatimonadetes bacterium]|nr:ABC transporter ATP-binding protein [Gemmatimonadota bacterium]